LNQHNLRRDEKARLYAEAIKAVKEFEELPYRIAKRADSGPTTVDDSAR
jgi:hypothetical protein